MKLPVQIRRVGSRNPFFEARYIVEDADERYVAESTNADFAEVVARALNNAVPPPQGTVRVEDVQALVAEMQANGEDKERDIEDQVFYRRCARIIGWLLWGPQQAPTTAEEASE